jgi:DNA-binding transcriptional regulator YiaG
MNDTTLAPIADTLEQHEHATEHAPADAPLRLPLYGQPPTSEVLREARLQADITQDIAARLVFTTKGAWSHWEIGRAQMSAAAWELFCCKVGRQAWYDRKMPSVTLPAPFITGPR